MRLGWLGFALVLGCAIEDPCDPSQEFRDGFCYETQQADPASQGGQGGDGGLGGAAGAGGASACPNGPYDHFGDVCSTDADCACPTEMCAVQPGQETGFCSRIHCLEDASICPPDWSCFDLTELAPEFGSICFGS